VVSLMLLVGQLLATVACVGAMVGWPVGWVEENVLRTGKGG
jgi:hypothetical protein